MDGSGATHVAHMRGNRAGFVDVLAGFVDTGSHLSEPLRLPVDDVDRIRFSLQGLGPAHVESSDTVIMLCPIGRCGSRGSLCRTAAQLVLRLLEMPLERYSNGNTSATFGLLRHHGGTSALLNPVRCPVSDRPGDR